MGESGGWVGGADESESTVVLGVFEGNESVFEGVESVGDSIVNVAIDVGVPDETMDNLSSTH